MELRSRFHHRNEPVYTLRLPVRGVTCQSGRHNKPYEGGRRWDGALQGARCQVVVSNKRRDWEKNRKPKRKDSNYACLNNTSTYIYMISDTFDK